MFVEKRWRVKRGSNPQLAVLETAALPIELFTPIRNELEPNQKNGWARVHKILITDQAITSVI
jgi:hypothetical protein